MVLTSNKKNYHQILSLSSMMVGEIYSQSIWTGLQTDFGSLLFTKALLSWHC